MDDCLRLSLKEVTDKSQLTKRNTLSMAAKIFDPLGFMEPFTIRAKIMMQALWKAKLQWDEPLSTQFADPWQTWLRETEHLISIQVPRPYFLSDRTDPQLHIFCDSSTKAYGAVANLRITSSIHGPQTSFVMGKSTVALLKEQTLTRLELLAALTGARLSATIREELAPPLGLLKTMLWTDSQIVLYWLSSVRKTKQFVCERVKVIRDITRSHTWKYCPSKDNPADLLTRGCSAKSLTEMYGHFWFHGPWWPNWKLPSTVVMSSSDDDEPETTCLATVLETRYTAYHGIRELQHTATATELASARTRWIHATQHH